MNGTHQLLVSAENADLVRANRAAIKKSTKTLIDASKDAVKSQESKANS
jgi:hypothetical protein